MKSSISYKNCFIRGESFQCEKDGKWIPQYTLKRQESKNMRSDFLSHQAKLKKIFTSENAADDFALQEAMKWIDKNGNPKS
ncbi:MAG: hypothetical protein WCH75_19895 [Candidatus Binatia bacterium]